MNRNLFNSGKEKPPSFNVGLIIALFTLLMAAPIIGIFALVGVIIYFISKNRKNETKVEDLRTTVNKPNDVKKEVQVLNTDDYINLTDSQKRLEELKSLYNNGFMSKDEYYEKRNKITNGAKI
jgi:uncharacterized membrane protein